MNQRVNLSNDRALEGLPTADDYSPEALGTVETRTGEPEQEWPEFGLEMVPIEYRSSTQDEWTDTGRRIVNRNGKFISDVSGQYKLLPNERLVGAANEVARELGASPFHEFDGDWFVQLDDHVFQDTERRRVHAIYAWDKGVIGGDDMEYGFAVHNSIDGSLGFSVGLFTFRHACQNMVFIGTGSSQENWALNVERERGVANKTTHRHTSGLAVDKAGLMDIIKETVLFVPTIDETYQQWVGRVVTPEEVAGLLDRSQLSSKDLPKWMHDIPGLLEDVYADEYRDGEEMPWEHKAELIEAEIPRALDVWDLYNDITEPIWHRGTSQDTTRKAKMRALHKVYNPGESGGVNLR